MTDIQQTPAPAASDFPKAELPASHRNVLEVSGNVKLGIAEFKESFERIAKEISKGIVGLKDEINLVVASIFVDRNVLMEGRPGLAKTRLAQTVADTLGLSFKRIQFTADLMPSDITGSLVLDENRKFKFCEGPIFANVILADEINRSSPKTQSALLEAMQEKQITVNGVTYLLPRPFIVIATQNPLESAGTFPLPDAQLDRFGVMLKFKNLSLKERIAVNEMTTTNDSPKILPAFSSAEEAQAKLMAGQQLIRSVEVPDRLKEYIARISCSLDPNNSDGVPVSDVKQKLEAGPSPRADQAIVLLAKVNALLSNRGYVMKTDIDQALQPVLRHRVVPKIEMLDGNLQIDALILKVRDAVTGAMQDLK